MIFFQVLAKKENHHLLFDLYDDDGNENDIIAVG